MWQGDGWIRTRRQLGVAGVALLFILDGVFKVGVPVGLYGLVLSLLGLGELSDALSNLRVGGGRK